MLPIVTPKEMAHIDAAAPEGTDALIARAGAEVALAARRMLGGTYGRRALVAAGKGNNGADGKVAASVLRRWGVRCQVVTPADALDLVAADGLGSNRWDLVVDAAYGTGLRGSWGADQPPSAPVLAVDIPSGIDALTGADLGCWPAAATVTFGALKPGLLLHPGAAAAGSVQLAPIGLDASAATCWLVTDADAHAVLGGIEPTAHKWRRSVRVIAGSPQMSGAGHLVCAAAQRAGAGMVVISSPGVRSGEIARPAEAIARDLGGRDWAETALEGIERFDAAVIGPGVGTDPATLEEMARFISRCPLPLVVDADALTAVADRPECLAGRSAATVLTPHDGEFARLRGASPDGDRFEAVRQAAAALSAIVLLKGPATLVASPRLSRAPGTVLAVNSGTARLATAGSGDVLSGVVAAVLAGNLGTDQSSTDPARAVAAAARWHGRTVSLPTEPTPMVTVPLIASAQIECLVQARAVIANAASGPEQL